MLETPRRGQPFPVSAKQLDHIKQRPWSAQVNRRPDTGQVTDPGASRQRGKKCVAMRNIVANRLGVYPTVPP